MQFMPEICNHVTMFILHIAGLRVDNSKSVIVKRWNIVWGKRTEVPKSEQRDTIDSLLLCKVIIFRHSFQQHQTCQLQMTTFVHPTQWVQ